MIYVPGRLEVISTLFFEKQLTGIYFKFNPVSNQDFRQEVIDLDDDEDDSTLDDDASTVDDTEDDDEDPQENVPQSVREEVTYCRIGDHEF